MDWFLAALISAVTLSGQGLLFQRLQKYYPINTFMTYAWLGAALALSIFLLRPEDIDAIGRNIVPLGLAGITSITGNYALNRAIHLQTNIGYIEAVMSWRLIVTYIFSIMAFSAPFEVIGLLGIVLIVCGVLAVSQTYRMKVKDISIGWVNWALLGGLSFALMSIFVRYAKDDGVQGEVSIIVVLIVAGVGFLIAALREKSSLRVETRHLGLFASVIACASIGNAALFIAYAKAPNLAYAIAIDNSRIIILYVIGLILFNEKLNWIKALGIGLTFIGILLLN